MNRFCNSGKLPRCAQLLWIPGDQFGLLLGLPAATGPLAELHMVNGYQFDRILHMQAAQGHWQKCAPRLCSRAPLVLGTARTWRRKKLFTE